MGRCQSKNLEEGGRSEVKRAGRGLRLEQGLPVAAWIQVPKAHYEPAKQVMGWRGSPKGAIYSHPFGKQ